MIRKTAGIRKTEERIRRKPGKEIFRVKRGKEKEVRQLTPEKKVRARTPRQTPLVHNLVMGHVLEGSMRQRHQGRKQKTKEKGIITTQYVKTYN